MSEDPIEIDFITNSPEMRAEFDKNMAKLKDHDISVEKAKQTFLEMSAEEIKAINKISSTFDGLLTSIKKTANQKISFSPEELANFENELNNSTDGLKSLGVLLDFISSKIPFMDGADDEVKALVKGIVDMNQILGRTPEIISTTGLSISDLKSIQKELKKALEEEINPANIKVYNQNLETVTTAIKRLENAGKTGFDDTGNKIASAKEKTNLLNQELNRTVGELLKMKQAGKDTGDEWDSLVQKAAGLKSIRDNANQEIKVTGSDTKSLDALLSLTKNIATGFGLAQGAQALFGEESKNIEKSILKVTAAMSVLQSLQELQLELKSKDSTITKIQAAGQAAYTAVVGTSTGALKLFRIALASTGIGLIILLLASLVANWDKVSASVRKSFPALDGFGDRFDGMKARVMGFLNAYLSLWTTVYNTLKKLWNTDWKGAAKELGNIGSNAKAAYTEGKEKSLADSAEDKRKEAVTKENEVLKRDYEVKKARGERALAEQRKYHKNNISLYKEGTDEYKKAVHDRNMFEAETYKENKDIAKKAAEKKAQEAKQAADKAKAEAKRRADELKREAQARMNFLAKLGEEEDKLSYRAFSQNSEEVNIKSKYNALRNDAKGLKFGNNVEPFKKIDALEKKELETNTYKIATEELIKNINEQKDIYAAYEAFKSKVGIEEAKKRYGVELQEFESFIQRMDEEIAKLSNMPERSVVENDRLQKLQDFKKKGNDAESAKKQKELEDAVVASQTLSEKLLKIEEDFQTKKAALQGLNDVATRTAKIAELERQKKDSITSAQDEAFQKSEIFRTLSDQTLNLNRKQLKQRIAALQEYLNTEKNLSTQQKDEIQKKIDSAKAIDGNSDKQVYVNKLLEDRKKLEEACADKTKLTAEQYVFLKQRIFEVNEELKNARIEKLQQVSDWASMISSSFSQLSNAIGDSNEGLADTLGTIGELAGAVSSVAEGLMKSLISGNPIAAIGGVISGISTVLSLGKKARESEKKAQEEIKKRQDAAFQSQVDYNAELRKRLAMEIKINDAYQSRVSAIKEEMNANRKNKESILRDYQMVFQRLLRSQTIVGQYTEKYGGFLGMWQKTRVVDINRSIAELLGINGNSSMTDDILDRLDELNAKQPLTGDAKTAYEQLKKLRDEYGSIADAQRELEKQLKDAVTGTTAQALADSIRQGILSGKKQFADFSDDIENFLRQGIIAGMSAKVIEPQIQKLQDELANFLGDGILSEEEKLLFNEMYMKIAKEGEEYMKLMNQAGITITGNMSGANSMQGAIKAASQESIDILSGHAMGGRLAQLETNQILKAGAAQQLAASSKMLEVQLDIEKNTRRTADNTERLHDINDGVGKLEQTTKQQYNDLKAAGII